MIMILTIILTAIFLIVIELNKNTLVGFILTGALLVSYFLCKNKIFTEIKGRSALISGLYLFCLDLPDIVSYNLYPEWYVQDKTAKEWVEENYNWVQEKTKGAGKPFLITEIGAGAIYGYRSQTHDNWTEEYQAEVLDHQLNAVFSTEGISGVFIWQYCDVRISREWFNIRPRTMNNKGIVDEYRRRKLAYDVVKKIYRSYGNYFE